MTKRQQPAMLFFAVAACITPLHVAHTQDQSTHEEEMRALYDQALNPENHKRNAAVLYREAFDELAKIGPTLQELQTQIADQLEIDPGRDAYRTPEVHALRAQAQSVLAKARMGARMDFAEFGLNDSDGFETLVPHYGPMRQMGRLLDLETRALRAEGRPGEAAETLGDLMRMSRHTSSDNMLIGSLVGASVARLSFDALDDAVAWGELDASQAQSMLRALDSETEDPYRFSASITGEFDLAVESLTAMENPGDYLAQALAATPEELKAMGPELDALNNESMEELTAPTREAYDLAAAVFAEPDPDTARAMAEQLEDAVEQGEYGALAKLILPTISKVLEAKLDLDERTKRAETTLRAIASGEDPARFANAAILYAQAFPKLRRISPRRQETLEIVRQIVTVTGSCDSIPQAMLDDASAALEEAAPIIGLLRSAARFERCDWKEAAPMALGDNALAQGRWVAPMRAAARLLQAQAALAACMGESGEAERANALADALAVGIHLGDGSHLFGSATAAATLTDTIGLFTTTAKSSGALTAKHHELFETRLARIDGSDPIGFNSARLNANRESVYRIPLHFGINDAENAERLVRFWSADRLATLVFMQVTDGLEEPTVVEMFPVANRNGELFLLEDVMKINDTTREKLSAHTKLFDLLAAVDSTRPINITLWRTRGLAALSQLDHQLSE